MSELKGGTGELRATITVKRKATGKEETYELVGHTTPEQHAQIEGQARKNRVHGSSGGMTGQVGGLTNKGTKDGDNP